MVPEVPRGGRVAEQTVVVVLIIVCSISDIRLASIASGK
jgi:hypothetical protein